MNWWTDLLTTYTHAPELQEITALSLISTIHRSPQHPLSLFPACCVFTSRFLATASNSGDSSASRPGVWSSQPPVQNSSQLTDDSQAGGHFFQLTWSPIVFKITPRHGPHRKNGCILLVQLLQFSSNELHNVVSNSNSIVVVACLPRCCIATAVVSLFVSRSSPINGSTRHNMKYYYTVRRFNVPAFE
jgi:hypothetical protein